ncbi:hypothetical protein LCGC14_2005880 [marine sediment metagenome]|uniref:Uncharacterized protein n=1 Tax=marine sediment metagenome TaxID=412755 RepID=A0A0F9FPG2_9ZZZZ
MANTKHKEDCERVFKNYDMTCPRCIELANGSPAREGWQRRYYEDKAREEKRFAHALATHDCVKSNCSPVCTAFDW